MLAPVRPKVGHLMGNNVDPAATGTLALAAKPATRLASRSAATAISPTSITSTLISASIVIAGPVTLIESAEPSARRRIGASFLLPRAAAPANDKAHASAAAGAVNFILTAFDAEQRAVAGRAVLVETMTIGVRLRIARHR